MNRYWGHSIPTGTTAGSLNTSSNFNPNFEAERRAEEYMRQQNEYMRRMQTPILHGSYIGDMSMVTDPTDPNPGVRLKQSTKKVLLLK